MTGEFARSKAGHDKDRVYIVVGEEGDFLYLCDGEARTLDRPKKKRIKHVQSISHVKPEGFATNEQIKREIKKYLKEEE